MCAADEIDVYSVSMYLINDDPGPTDFIPTANGPGLIFQRLKNVKMVLIENIRKITFKKYLCSK